MDIYPRHDPQGPLVIIPLVNYSMAAHFHFVAVSNWNTGCTVCEDASATCACHGSRLLDAQFTPC